MTTPSETQLLLVRIFVDALAIFSVQRSINDDYQDSTPRAVSAGPSWIPSHHMISWFLSLPWPIRVIAVINEGQDIAETIKPPETVDICFVTDPTKLVC